MRFYIFNLIFFLILILKKSYNLLFYEKQEL